jgi:hypothetical protein
LRQGQLTGAYRGTSKIIVLDDAIDVLGRRSRTRSGRN